MTELTPISFHHAPRQLVVVLVADGDVDLRPSCFNFAIPWLMSESPRKGIIGSWDHLGHRYIRVPRPAARMTACLIEAAARRGVAHVGSAPGGGFRSRARIALGEGLGVDESVVASGSFTLSLKPMRKWRTPPSSLRVYGSSMSPTRYSGPVALARPAPDHLVADAVVLLPDLEQVADLGGLDGARGRGPGSRRFDRAP